MCQQKEACDSVARPVESSKPLLKLKLGPFSGVLSLASWEPSEGLWQRGSSANPQIGQIKEISLRYARLFDALAEWLKN
jgi:hypothetical protein